MVARRCACAGRLLRTPGHLKPVKDGQRRQHHLPHALLDTHAVLENAQAGARLPRNRLRRGEPPQGEEQRVAPHRRRQERPAQRVELSPPAPRKVLAAGRHALHPAHPRAAGPRHTHDRPESRGDRPPHPHRAPAHARSGQVRAAALRDRGSADPQARGGRIAAPARAEAHPPGSWGKGDEGGRSPWVADELERFEKEQRRWQGEDYRAAGP
mmetsp:Transcript_23701/g.46215  ORF Transcript_23701/g.46215 Transcript_23701/m.46215 type:complete len:212 (-) Transcript_23701:479-1114(-)